MNDLINKVLQWGASKGITGPNGTGTLKAQAKKMREESNETFDAALELHIQFESGELAPQQKTIEELIDGIGDTTVTLILLAEMAGVTLEECLQAAYEVISKRNGTMVDGTFVKSNQNETDVKPWLVDGPSDDKWKRPSYIDSDLNEPLGQACQLGDTECESCS